MHPCGLIETRRPWPGISLGISGTQPAPPPCAPSDRPCTPHSARRGRTGPSARRRCRRQPRPLRPSASFVSSTLLSFISSNPSGDAATTSKTNLPRQSSLPAPPAERPGQRQRTTLDRRVRLLDIWRGHSDRRGNFLPETTTTRTLAMHLPRSTQAAAARRPRHRAPPRACARI